MQKAIEVRNKRKAELDQTIKELRQQTFRERNMHQFMANDFYFDGILGIKTKEPVEHVSKTRPSLKSLLRCSSFIPSPTTGSHTILRNFVCW